MSLDYFIRIFSVRNYWIGIITVALVDKVNKTTSEMITRHEKELRTNDQPKTSVSECYFGNVVDDRLMRDQSTLRLSDRSLENSSTFRRGEEKRKPQLAQGRH